MKKPAHVDEAPGDSLDMVAEQDRQHIEIFTGWDATTPRLRHMPDVRRLLDRLDELARGVNAAGVEGRAVS